MKKTWLAFVLAATALNVNAQKGAHVGVHGMVNASFIINQNAYGLEEYDYKQKMAGGGGLVLGYNFTDHVGLQTEINILSLGQNYQRSQNPVDFRRYELSYTAVPILFKYTSGEGMVKFYGQIGPQFMFLSNAGIKYLDATETVQATYNAPKHGGGTQAVTSISGAVAEERFEKTNVGLNFGLGANISIIPAIYVNAGLSFYYGFSDINSDAPTTDPLAYYTAGNTTGTWQWPDLSLGKYEPSKNAYGGLDIGVHYLFLRD